ncbi:MAG: glycosyltransferase [Tannerellaceae bacterium]|jgi:glycosyltransferase involved in cell wall biosynthesis|nr:glycosyltransferase [Tannerellaceae bacterium]
MKVLFDMTYCSAESRAGVIIFAYRLLKGIYKIHKQKEVVLLLSEENVGIAQYEYLREFEFVVIPLAYGKITDKIPHLRGLLNKKRLDKLILKYGFSLFFSPCFFMHGLYTGRIPHIGVLHDAQGYILKKGQPLKGRVFRWRMNSLLNGVEHIITISNASKRIIQQVIHPVPEISVIYNSIDIKDDTKKIDKSIEKLLDKPYILCVNALVAYKNFQTLIRAFALLRKEMKHYLIIKGVKTSYWTHTLEPLICELGISDSVILIDKTFNDDEMAMLYKKAVLFVSPSLMEGFGFTPIEAAMYETSVITSGIPALYETTLGLLTYYEPATDHIVLANAIKNVIDAPLSMEQKSLIAAKLKEKYSVAQQAKNYYEFFKSYKISE